MTHEQIFSGLKVYTYFLEMIAIFFNGTETILVLKKIAKFIVLFSQKFNLKKKFYYNQEIADGDYNKSLWYSVFFPIFRGKEFYWEII